MRSFSTNDLNKQVGEVTDAAAREPIQITRHRKPRFVMMSLDHYRSLTSRADPRQAYGVGETPDHIAKLFEDVVRALARGEGYDEAG